MHSQTQEQLQSSEGCKI